MKENQEDKVFLEEIDGLTPSQLYISADKLKKVRSWFDGDIAKMEPVSVKKLAGRLLITDGHTRAVTAFLAGIKHIPCVWETGEWDWAAYASDINMCAEEGITSVEKLADRIVSGEEYGRLWCDRCDAMYDQWYYKVLKQDSEIIYFTRTQTALSQWDIRPADPATGDGAEEDGIEYYHLYDAGIPVARGCIERYSYEFWEAADIKTYKGYRNRGYGFAITSFLTNRITAAGKTATCRTLPENIHMARIIEKCGYQRLYARAGLEA